MSRGMLATIILTELSRSEISSLDYFDNTALESLGGLQFPDSREEVQGGLLEVFNYFFRAVFGQFVGRISVKIFDQTFGRIFAQSFDQGLGEGKNYKYSVQYYPA